MKERRETDIHLPGEETEIPIIDRIRQLISHDRSRRHFFIGQV